jgi:hypothetical protein
VAAGVGRHEGHVIVESVVLRGRGLEREEEREHGRKIEG